MFEFLEGEKVTPLQKKTVRVCGFNILMWSEQWNIICENVWSVNQCRKMLCQYNNCVVGGHQEQKKNIHITIIANHIERLSIPIFDIHRLLYRKEEKNKWNIKFSIHLVAFTHALVVHCSYKNEWNSYLSQFAVSIPKLQAVAFLDIPQ